MPIICHTSAQVLAAYGAVDIPQKSWPNLLVTLFGNISSPDVHESCKVASLEVSFVSLPLLITKSPFHSP